MAKTWPTLRGSFCQLRTLHPDPSLMMGGDPIKVVKEMRFLGLVFDTKLSFLPHIRALKARCMKALDVLKVLSATEWGADSTILLQLYRALVRSKLDYGSTVYGSTRKSYVKLLDPVHHQGLRLSLGVFRMSPIQSLYVEAREPSLENRRLKLSLQYTVKLETNPLNPAHACVFHPEYQPLYDSKPTSIRPLGLRVSPIFRAWGSNWTTWPSTTCLTLLRGSLNDLTLSSSSPRRGSLTRHPSHTTISISP